MWLALWLASAGKYLQLTPTNSVGIERPMGMLGGSSSKDSKSYGLTQSRNSTYSCNSAVTNHGNTLSVGLVDPSLWILTVDLAGGRTHVSIYYIFLFVTNVTGKEHNYVWTWKSFIVHNKSLGCI